MPTAVVSQPAQDQAIEYCCDVRFHRSFVLPGTAAHGPLRVTYSVAGLDGREHGNVPTIVFINGMFGGRYGALDMDYLARQKGVRVVFVDRPGMGGSTSVKLQQRVQVWLETLTALLDLLKIKHVVLVGHSSGTIYLLNTLVHMRDVLSPKKPYVVLLAPWVHPTHSQVKALALAEMVPESMIRNWNQVNKFFATSLMPMKASSSGVFGDIISSIGFGGKPVDDAVERSLIEEYHGVTKEVQDAVDRLQDDYAWAEETVGANDESMLCLKKAGPGLWGACEDYPTFVRQLASGERERRDRGLNKEHNLKVHTFFAESDMMIGKNGQSYFEACWGRDITGGAVDFEAITTTNTNHDSICGAQRGVLERIFVEARLVLD